MSCAALDGARIAARIAELRPGPAAPVIVKASTGSTNDDAKALARSGSAHGAAVLAEAQTHGRGRSGSRWYSPAGENLTLSIVLLPGAIGASTATFSLVVGLCVARAVEAAAGGSLRAGVKWPNDVLVERRKIAGVLIEGASGQGRATLVVGVGVNVGSRSFPPELSELATSLAREGALDVDRSLVAADIVAGVLDAWDAFASAGLEPWLGELARRDALRGRSVRVEAVSGVAEGIAPDGRLLVRTPPGDLVSVVAGHVELLDLPAQSPPR